MKRLLSILLLVPVMGCTPAVAAEVWNDGSMRQSGYSKTRTCYRSEYREEYVPGTETDPGYVKSWKETVEVPCDKTAARGTRVYTETVVEYDDNDCSDGTLAGGILGGGLATAISRGKDRWWAIPTGILTGAVIGCDIDGG